MNIIETITALSLVETGLIGRKDKSLFIEKELSFLLPFAIIGIM